MRILEVAANMEVNIIKSGAVVRHRTLHATVAETLGQLGVGVKTELKDLCVIQGHSKEATLLVGDRWNDCIDRWERVGVLPLPMRYKAQVAAASGLGAGAYGSAAQPLAESTVWQLRRHAARAIYAGSSQVSINLLWHVSGITWRSDPLLAIADRACVAVAHLWSSGGAADVRYVWQNGMGLRGPVQALRTALANLKISGGLDSWTDCAGAVLVRPPAQVPASQLPSSGHWAG